MVSEFPSGESLDHVPASLFRHPAWGAWKEKLGWTKLEVDDPDCGVLFLTRSLGPEGSMVFIPGALPPESWDCGLAEDRGALLEELSSRIEPLLPDDCVFLRWDLVFPQWNDDEGRALSPRLSEFRMNASTQSRRFRKSAVEATCTDTMVVDLTGGPEAVLSRMDSRTRYSVRLAERRGTVVRRAGDEDLYRFYELYRETSRRQDLRTYPEDCFRDLFATAEDGGLSLDLYLAETAGETAAAAVIARHAGEAWYLFAASSAKHRAAAGPSAILHRALLDCEAAGDVRMDLLGVAPQCGADHPLSRLTRFKAGFGGERVSRAGAWDFVIDPEAYSLYAQAEALTAGGVRL